jgi:hypothetical protein
MRSSVLGPYPNAASKRWRKVRSLKRAVVEVMVDSLDARGGGITGVKSTLAVTLDLVRSRPEQQHQPCDANVTEPDCHPSHGREKPQAEI